MMEQKRLLPIGFAFMSVALITVFYVDSSTNNYSLRFLSYPFVFFNNRNQLPRPRVLCLILTSPQHFLTRATAVNETWAPRCDRYFFITETPTNQSSPEFEISKEIPIAPLKDIKPGYFHLTQKSVLSLLFAYEHYLNDFDWFVKADDDTYLFIENLKAFLSDKNPSEPVTFGYNFKTKVSKGYHSGGASYVLSRESLRRFYEAQNNPKSNCRKDGGAEDVEIAQCLRTKGVYPGKALDKYGRELFHPLSFIDHFRGRFPDWLAQYAETPLQSHYNCCGDQTISFHYVGPAEQYLIDFILYKVRSPSKYSVQESNETPTPVN